MARQLFATERDYGLLVLRLVLGVVFFIHGSQKVLGWFGGHGLAGTLSAFVQMMHIPVVFAILAIAAEFLGGLALILGLLGRVAAFGLFCDMAVAVALVHLSNGFFMNWTGTQKGEGFEYHLLVMAIAVALMLRGSGALSLDRLIAKQT